MADLAATAGLVLDPWQKLILDHGLDERRSDGYRWASREVAVVVSRQNGKGSLLEALELGDLFLLDTELVIHSAHWAPTSQEALRRLRTLLEQSPDLDRMFTKMRGKVWTANGKEGIELYRDGGWHRLRFQTRTKSGGRGLSGDRVVIDEAMIYDAEMDSALRPTMSARENPQLWMLGSAGDRDSVIFGKARRRGMAGKDPRLCYFEWSVEPCSQLCPKDCDEHDPADERLGSDRLLESYVKANPALGFRISLEAIEAERASMDPDMFARERLGVGDWPIEGGSWRVVDEESWMSRTVHRGLSRPRPPYVFGIDVTPDRRYSCIAVAGDNGEGQVHVEVTGDGFRYDHRPGTEWVVRRALELAKAHRPCTFVVDKAFQASTLIDALEAGGIKMLHPNVREYAQACGIFHDSVVKRAGNDPILVHIDQPMLNTAVAGAETRQLSGMWAWDRSHASVDISPLVAVTLARWGHQKLTDKPKARPNLAWG